MKVVGGWSEVGVEEMTQREITHSLVEVMQYEYFHPESGSQDAVYGFTHSQEVNAICADVPPPHTVTPVDREELEQALVQYLRRRGINAEDAARIRSWLANMPDEVAIIEREP